MEDSQEPTNGDVLTRLDAIDKRLEAFTFYQASCIETQQARWLSHNGSHMEEHKRLVKLRGILVWVTITAVAALVVSVIALAAVLFLSIA